MYSRLAEFVRCSFLPAGRWVLLVFMFVPGVVNAQANDLPPPNSEPQGPESQTVIDEITAIRNQLGGGIGEQLQGLDFGKSLNAELQKDFQQELNRLATQIQTVPKPRDPQVFQGSPQQLNQQRFFQDQSGRASGRSEFFEPKSANLQSPASHVRPLRSAARRLDEIAAELEEVGLYHEADSVREQARSFWLKARLGEKQCHSENHPRNR